MHCCLCVPTLVHKSSRTLRALSADSTRLSRRARLSGGAQRANSTRLAGGARRTRSTGVALGPGVSLGSRGADVLGDFLDPQFFHGFGLQVEARQDDADHAFVGRLEREGVEGGNCWGKRDEVKVCKSRGGVGEGGETVQIIACGREAR